MSAAGSGCRFEPYYQAFRELERSLAATEWFADGWRAQVGYYGGKTPQGVSFRLYRDGWFSETGGGIHLESWISSADIKRGSVPVALHVETSAEKTGIKRGLLNNAVLQEGASLMDGWNNYKTSSNSYQTLIRHLPVTPGSLAGELKTEYARLRLLAPIIDRVVREASPHPSEAK